MTTHRRGYQVSVTEDVVAFAPSRMTSTVRRPRGTRQNTGAAPHNAVSPDGKIDIPMIAHCAVWSGIAILSTDRSHVPPLSQ